MNAIKIKDDSGRVAWAHHDGRGWALGIAHVRPEGRFNGKCRCGAKFSALARALDVPGGVRLEGVRWSEVFHAADGALYRPACHGDRFALVRPCPCGRRVVCKAVSGRFVAEKGCDGRCMSATGHSCECSCGGRNHGAAHG